MEVRISLHTSMLNYENARFLYDVLNAELRECPFLVRCIESRVYDVTVTNRKTNCFRDIYGFLRVVYDELQQVWEQTTVSS